MRLVELLDPWEWVIQHNEKTVALGGTTHFKNRESIVAELAARGFVVLDNGEIVRASERPVDAPEVQEPIEDVKDAPRAKRGRPRTYSEEEAAERRRAQNREYYRARPAERKAEVRERSKEWWATHPEAVNQYRQTANERRRERYKTDLDYRARVDASNRAYQERKREAKIAAQMKVED